MKPHHWRHIISGIIVFSSGIAVDQGLAYWREHRPVYVIWQTGQHQSAFVRSYCVPTNGSVCQFGVADNGTVVWRHAP